jgi:hypothetical protein
MANLTNALQQLREERERAQSQVEKLDSAISVLEDLVGGNGSRTVRISSRGGRVVSAIARRRMAAAQRARWAKVRTQSQTNRGGKSSGTAIARRILSAAARRKIAAAQRARWARIKAQRKEAA